MSGGRPAELPEVYLTDEEYAEFIRLFETQQKYPKDRKVVQELDQAYNRICQKYKLSRTEIVGISHGGKIITKYHEMQEHLLGGTKDGSTRYIKDANLGAIMEELRMTALEAIVTNSDTDDPMQAMINYQLTIMGICKSLIANHERLMTVTQTSLVQLLHVKFCEECANRVKDDKPLIQEHLVAYLKRYRAE